MDEGGTPPRRSPALRRVEAPSAFRVRFRRLRRRPGLPTTLGAVLRAPHAEQGVSKDAGHLVDATLHVGASFLALGVRGDLFGLRGLFHATTTQAAALGGLLLCRPGLSA